MDETTRGLYKLKQVAYRSMITTELLKVTLQTDVWSTVKLSECHTARYSIARGF